MQWGDWSCIRCAELPNKWRCGLHDYAEDAADFTDRVPYCAQLVVRMRWRRGRPLYLIFLTGRS
jgi:hypothetical protein